MHWGEELSVGFEPEELRTLYLGGDHLKVAQEDRERTAEEEHHESLAKARAAAAAKDPTVVSTLYVRPRVRVCSYRRRRPTLSTRFAKHEPRMHDKEHRRVGDVCTDGQHTGDAALELKVVDQLARRADRSSVRELAHHLRDRRRRLWTVQELARLRTLCAELLLE